MPRKPALQTPTPHWCILRTAGSSTLGLVRSLSNAGFDAWTPIEVQVKRNRRSGERLERMVAVMPTYVFVRADHLPDLAMLCQLPISQHPQFSIFMHAGQFPMVEDGELSALRDIERKAAAKNEPVKFRTGDMVRPTSSGFEGLTGQVVKDSDGKHTLVAFPGFHIPIIFASWKLEPFKVNEANVTASKAE